MEIGILDEPERLLAAFSHSWMFCGLSAVAPKLWWGVLDRLPRTLLPRELAEIGEWTAITNKLSTIQSTSSSMS